MSLALRHLALYVGPSGPVALTAPIAAGLDAVITAEPLHQLAASANVAVQATVSPAIAAAIIVVGLVGLEGTVSPDQLATMTAPVPAPLNATALADVLAALEAASVITLGASVTATISVPDPQPTTAPSVLLIGVEQERHLTAERPARRLTSRSIERILTGEEER